MWGGMAWSHACAVGPALNGSIGAVSRIARILTGSFFARLRSSRPQPVHTSLSLSATAA